jgi:hypothetical protein
MNLPIKVLLVSFSMQRTQGDMACNNAVSQSTILVFGLLGAVVESPVKH